MAWKWKSQKPRKTGIVYIPVKWHGEPFAKRKRAGGVRRKERLFVCEQKRTRAISDAGQVYWEEPHRVSPVSHVEGLRSY